ncbi:MAG: hypothetical protein LBL39_01300 [Planctomycetaceae bacterium]|nr:hypothetical protein [Planctomycetaceae bacterium]
MKRLFEGEAYRLTGYGTSQVDLTLYSRLKTAHVNSVIYQHLKNIFSTSPKIQFIKIIPIIIKIQYMTI